MSRARQLKIANAIFKLTADEPATVQKYGHENGASRFHMKKVKKYWGAIGLVVAHARRHAAHSTHSTRRHAAFGGWAL